MKRKIRLWTIAACLLALAVTVLPVISRIAFLRENARQLAAAENRISSLEDEQLEKQRNLAKWYNFGLEWGDPGIRWAYDNILNFGGGAMGILEVQALKLRMPIYHGMEQGIGHDPQTPFPIGGRGNHTILSLDREYNWEKGMLVCLECLDTCLVYQVESVQVMPPDWSTQRPNQTGQDLLTLVYDTGSTRTLIRCIRAQELTVRPVEHPNYHRVLLASLSPMLVSIPVLCAKMLGRFHVRRPRLFGFFHKNRRKPKLSRKYGCKILKIDV